MRNLSRKATVTAVLFCLLNIATAARGQSDIAVHIVMSIIPVSAFAKVYMDDNSEGQKQYWRNLLANQLLTSAARVGFDETSWGERPTGNPYGFPSGHVAFAGSGASFFQERYGWQYGVPAWLATGYVAWARVENGHHWARDVIAAAALSYGVGLLFVTPESAAHLAPVVGPEFLGLRWQRSW